MASFVWLATSMTLTVTLKEVLDPHHFGFRVPLGLTVFSFLTSFALMALFSRPPELLLSKASSILKEVALPLGISTALEVATSNLAYPLISVSVMSILKCATVVTTLVGGMLVRVEKPNLYLFFIMLVLVAGVVLACKEIEVDKWEGVVLMSLSTVAYSWRSLLTQTLHKTCPLTPREFSYLVMPAAGLVLLPVAVILEAREWSAWKRPRDWDNYTEIRFVLSVISIPIVAFVNMFMMFEIVVTSSSLSMAVLIALRQVLGIIGGICFFQDKWTWRAWIGLALTLFAMLEYARVRAKDKTGENVLPSCNGQRSEQCCAEDSGSEAGREKSFEDELAPLLRKGHRGCEPQ
jgi:drug/metabolite transporter (DMT)-like permease